MERRYVLKDFEGFIENYATRDFIYFLQKNLLKYIEIR